MATVTKPIALDESLNTTELSSRNVADVLAQELSAVATAIGGISAPSAEDVSYDNSGSGLTADNVQDAIDELKSDIPTVNNGTLTIQQNGTSIGSFSANTASNVTADIKTPTSEIKTATTEFSTANGGLLSKCMIDLVPVQDLHGYDSPWVGGAGKNKFDIGVSRTISGTGFSVEVDEQGICEVIGTSSSYISTTLASFQTVNGVEYILTGCPSDGAYGKYRLVMMGYGYDYGDGYTFIGDGNTHYLALDLWNGYPAQSGTKFYPMIRLATETDPTFAPYSNICPISGHTEVGLYNVGKNRQVLTVEDIKSVSAGGVTWVGNSCVINNVTYTILTNSKNEVVGIKTNGTASGLSQITISKTYVKEGSYTFSSGIIGSNSTYYMRYVARDSNGNAISIDGSVFIDIYNVETTKALPSNVSYVNGYIGVINGVQANNLVFKPMIRKSTDTDSTFEPYHGHLYTINLGGTYYGGYDEIVSRKGKSTYAVADFGDLTWYYDSANTRFRGEMPSNYKQPTSASDRYQYLYCSCYKPDDSPVTGSHVNNTIGGFQGTSYVWVNDSAYTDAGQFKTARTGQKIAYLLSTPTDITHDSTQIETLAGQNNLSTPLSGQSIETNGVEYKELFTFADVKEYVDKKIPDAPTADGTYTLQAVVSGGVPTYSWV